MFGARERMREHELFSVLFFRFCIEVESAMTNRDAAGVAPVCVWITSVLCQACRLYKV